MEPSENERAFGAEVERCRTAAGMPQTAVARKIRLARSKVSEMESGRFLPSRRALTELVTALGMDPVRALDLWTAACTGRDQRRHAERMARVPRTTDWAALPPLPPAVRSLLRAQIDAAEEMPYRLRGARKPSLATVYVRQELSTGSEEQQEPRPLPAIHGARELIEPAAYPIARPTVRPPARTVAEALDGDQHLLVTGGPGQGKSTLSLRLSAEVATCWISSDRRSALMSEPVVPLRLTARELAKRLHLPFAEAVAETANAELGAFLQSAFDARLLGERVAGCRWLLLVDGLDEVTDGSQRGHLVAVLAARATEGPDAPYRMVLTTRPVDAATLAPLQRLAVARYKLLSFNEKDLQRFAEHWFDNDGNSAFRFIRQLRTAHLTELAGNPLLATIAAIIFEHSAGRRLPDNRYELYEEYLAYLRQARSGKASQFDNLCDGLLEHLAKVRLHSDTSLIEAACTWVAERLGPERRSAPYRTELGAFLTAAGPLVLRGTDLQFQHFSFAEHLAATAEARLLPNAFIPDMPGVAELVHTARFSERGRYARAVLLHYTRLRPDQSDAVIEHLHGGDGAGHLLAAQLLAEHAPASPPVVEAFLATARGWARTTRFPAQQVLEFASRVAHYPGLDEWLLAFVRDAEYPWPTRLEAANALATRLRDRHADEAVAYLRAVVDDNDLPVEQRLAAAEALVESGDGERTTAQRGLRAVLADPEVTAWTYRNAAMVLAGLGPDAHAEAVARLLALMDDVSAPEADRADAATGLLEVTFAHHERCAAVLVDALRWGRFGSALNRAAAALAALGPRYESEAADILLARATDLRDRDGDRIAALSTLAELGPQRRSAAGRLLAEYARRPFAIPAWSIVVAIRLAQLGPEFRSEAAALCRTLCTASTNSRRIAATTLADLGPGFVDEAVDLLHTVITDPTASPFDRASALGALAERGGHHRTTAVAGLRTYLDDYVDTVTAVEAADQLAGLGPEFHAEVQNRLVGVVRSRARHSVRAQAWRTLLRLGGKTLRARAAAALLELIGAADPQQHVFANSSDLANIPGVADVLTAIIHDPRCSGAARAAAVHNLIQLGRCFHRTAVDGTISLIQDGSGLGKDLNWVAQCDALSLHHRAELARAIQDAALHPDRPRIAPHAVAAVVSRLDCLPVLPEIVNKLRSVVADHAAPPNERVSAAVALVDAQPDELPTAAATVATLADADDLSTYAWRTALHEFAARGTDVVPHLRRLLSRPDITSWTRTEAAQLLCDLAATADGIAELRTHNDEFHEFDDRSTVLNRLAEYAADHRDAAIAFHRAVLHDDREPVADRSVAARMLAKVDRSAAAEALAVLRHFASSAEFTVEENAVALREIDIVGGTHDPVADRLTTGIAGHPAATPRTRRMALSWPASAERIGLTRALIDDRASSVNDWVADVDRWKQPALAAHAEASVRNILTAPETQPRERVAAAAALASLSPERTSEAAEHLMALQARPVGTRHAQRALADLGRPWRQRVITKARQTVEDLSLPNRARTDAAHLVADLTTDPPPSVVAQLREAARATRGADRGRILALYALRRFDGLDAIRTVRDNERTHAATRRQAALLLRRYTPADRAAGANVLHRIAEDPAIHPGIRWRAARDLMTFGTWGRERGAAALLPIAEDAALSTLARAGAARTLGIKRPDQRTAMIRILHDLTNTPKALHRIEVLSALGKFEPEDVAAALRDMAADPGLGAVARMRCAIKLADLHRDFRETAAMVAREIAHDRAAPRHIRENAARSLARWSELLRAEARAQLVELRG